MSNLYIIKLSSLILKFIFLPPVRLIIHEKSPKSFKFGRKKTEVFNVFKISKLNETVKAS